MTEQRKLLYYYYFKAIVLKNKGKQIKLEKRKQIKQKVKKQRKVTSSVSCRIQIIIKSYIFNYSKKSLPQRFELPRHALLGRAPTTQRSNFFSQL